MTQRDDLVSRLRDLAHLVERRQVTQPKAARRKIEDAATALETRDAEIARAMDMLGDVPGATLAERVERVVSYHLGLQCLLEESKTRIAELERQLAENGGRDE